MRTPIISVIVPVGDRDLVSPSMAAALLDAGYAALDVVFAVRNRSPAQRLMDAPEGTRILGYEESLQEIMVHLLGEWVCVIPPGGHVGHGFFDHLVAAAALDGDGSVAVTMHLTPGARIQTFPKSRTISLDDVGQADLPISVMVRTSIAPRFVGGAIEAAVWLVGAIAQLGSANVAGAARMMIVGEPGLLRQYDMSAIEHSVAELALDLATGDESVDGATMRFFQDYGQRKTQPQIQQRDRWLMGLVRSFPELAPQPA